MVRIQDAFEFMESQADFSADVVFSDPPYNLGSEVLVRPDGKVDYGKKVDFMDKWAVMGGAYWESWFSEAFRTLKHGGYCLMYGMDRQTLMFKYWAAKAGFVERQSIYWYFTQNFPKASDLGKNLDRNAGAEREKISENPNARPNMDGKICGYSGERSHAPITAPSTPLAKKYAGYKYSISPLKQCVETIMVFQKPYKTGSCLHDTLAYEAGDKTCGCGMVAIDDGRCGFDDSKEDDTGQNYYRHRNIPLPHKKQNREGFIPTPPKESVPTSSGRYPAQCFVSPEAAEALDSQSGIKTSGAVHGVYGHNEGFVDGKIEQHYEASSGGCSKILHKCPYEEGEHDLFMYAPKVSKKERNAGCEGMGLKNNMRINVPRENEERKTASLSNNFHPTLKPISLNTRILRLFKTPNPQRILIPFSGSGSEVIGAINAGFTDWEACEINPEYVAISEARIAHYQSKKV